MTIAALPGTAVPITRESLDEMLRAGGYLPMLSHERVVIATRPIAGHEYEAREVVFHRLGSHGWGAALFLQQLGRGSLVTAPLHESPILEDLDAAECWLAGVTSVPIDRREVDALTRVGS